MIRIDEFWLARELLDMRAGPDTTLARVVQSFGGVSHVPDEREYRIDFRMPLISKLELRAGARQFDNGIDSFGASLGLNYRLQYYLVLGINLESSGSREIGVGMQAQVYF